MMPRQPSKNTLAVQELAWYRPWASADDIGLVSSQKNNAISNVLTRGVESGLLKFETLGRVRHAVQRFVYSEEGVRRMHEERGWPIEWYHSAAGIKALARRLEIVEMAYHYVPQLWQSNLSGNGRCRVYKELLYAGPNGEPVWRPQLVELDWRGGRLAGFHWVGNELLEAMAIYDDGADRDKRLYVPVLLQGNFQRPADFEKLRWDIHDVMVEDYRWRSLPQRQASPVDCRPPVIMLSMAARSWTTVAE